MGVIPYPYLNIKRDISLNEAPGVLLLLFYYLGRLLLEHFKRHPDAIPLRIKTLSQRYYLKHIGEGVVRVKELHVISLH